MSHRFVASVMFCLLPALLGMGGYPSKYSAEAIEARVIDAETKRPLEGVIVTANWELEEGTLGGNVPVGQLMVMEAVTDKSGRFYLPAWGPKRPPKGGLRNKDPQLLLFKSGYHFRRLDNEFRDYMYEEPVHRSEWNGKTIEMKPFRGTIEEYANHLSFLNTSLESILSEECGWKEIPQMIIAIDRQAKIFQKRGIYGLPSIKSLEVRYTNFKARCGSVVDFFKSYQP